MGCESTDLCELTAVFRVEAEELLAAADESLVALEADPTRDDLVGEIFRAAHTIKGNAAARDLPAELMRVRMVPIGPAFRQQLRTARDAALALDKRVDLHLEGEDVELDTRVVDEIRDPLTHMVRNAVDHGIESRELRQAAGK